MLVARHTGLVAAALCVLAHAFPSAAQPPEGAIPPDLLGDWGGTFGSVGPLILRVTPGGATVVSTGGQTLGAVTGALAASGPLHLSVAWQLAVFQLGPGDQLPASAWPGSVSSDLALSYDSDANSLIGTYEFVNIGYDEQGSYQTVDRSTVPIRLIRTQRTETGTAAGPSEQP
jgi:hypothetical protein